MSENLRIQVNLLDAAHAAGVQRLVLLGSTTIYPKLVEQPIRESSLFTGPLEHRADTFGDRHLDAETAGQVAQHGRGGQTLDHHADLRLRAIGGRAARDQLAGPAISARG